MTARRAGLTLALTLLASSQARAQGRAEVRPSIGVSQAYDSNLFSTPSGRLGDVITRLTSEVESARRSTLLTLDGTYSLDVERFADHSELSTMNARQHASIAAGYHPSRRLTLETGAEIWTTRTPGELNADTGLTFARASARRATGRALLTGQFTPVMSGTAAYTVTVDHLAGGLETRTHTTAIGGERALSPRDSASVSYAFSRFLFESGTGTAMSATASHVLTAGVSRAVTRRVKVSIDGGPRVTGSSLSPELSASINYLGRSADLSVTYTRTETTIIGQAGTADTQSLTASGAVTVGRSLQMHVGPGFFRNSLDGRQIGAYALSIGAAHPIGRDLSLDVAFDSRIQRGRISGVANASIVRYSTLVRLVVAPAALR